MLEQRTLVFDEDGSIRPVRRSDYVLKTDPNTGAVVTNNYFLPNGKEVTFPVYKLTVDPTGGNELANGDRQINYAGINIGFQKPLANHWSLRGNFNYGDNKLKIGKKFKAEDDPTNKVSIGTGYYGDTNDIFVETSYGTHKLVLINSRWSFNVNALYQIAPEKPWGFNVAASINGREGYPFAPTTTANVRGLQLTPSLNDFRYDNVYTFDARIEKEVKVHDVGLTFSLEGFNLANTQPVLQRNPQAPSSVDDLATSYEVVERLSPRVFRWGVAIHFR